MCKDKRGIKSGGAKLFTFEKKGGNVEFDVIYQIAAYNMTKNLLGGVRPSKRAKSAEAIFMDYLENLRKEN